MIFQPGGGDPVVLRFTVSLLLISLKFLSTIAAQDRPEYQTGVVVVQFVPDTQVANKSARTGLAGFDRLASAYNVHTIERVYPFLDYAEPTPKTRRNLLALRRTYYVRYHADIDPVAVSREFSGALGVVYAEPIPVMRSYVSEISNVIDPNDPRYQEQPELRLLELPKAWDVVKSESRSPAVVIAIVDGGGEWGHEDLRANVWTNDDEIPDNGVDDDNNGFIDDVHGVNFANEDETNNDPTGLPHTPSSVEHGTASAGSASAVSDNDTGISGPAWNAELMHINANHPQIDGLPYMGYEGILYAAMNGADIINTSWGGPVGEDVRARHLDQSLDLATDMGSLVVNAAGNDGLNNDLFRNYPSRHPRVLSVGATEKETKRRAGFSNYGKTVDVFAPGVDILTTGPNHGYIVISGTSFSSPMVAGIAALVKTRFPDMPPDMLREKIRLSGESMDTQNPGFAGRLGRGFVNALTAVQESDLPGIRLKRWSWTDSGNDHAIHSGDVVQVTATFVNYLNDAEQLRIRLVGAESYAFIEMNKTEFNIGTLEEGDSTKVTFEFSIASDAPVNQQVRFYTHVQDGSHEDMADMLSFRVNRSFEAIHQSLSALYTATGGDQWDDNTNWDITRIPNEEELGKWYGVFLSEGWLALLDLSSNNLTGMIAPELGNLAELRYLLLGGNSLTGPLPPELGNLSELRALGLSNNSLMGPIPSELGNLSELRELGLWNNSLADPIPSELGNLSELQALNLSNNSLTGPIPSEVGNLFELQSLNLSDNSLTGPIPSVIGNLSELQYLNLSSNSFTGPIPSEFGNLSELRELNLWNSSLTGPIPSVLGNLSKLRDLFLQSNSLTGPIPSELGGLSVLRRLSLEANSFTGPIPSELGRLSELQELNLTNNSLTGPIPSELGNLSALQALSLSHNSLTGPIPSEFGNLSELRALELTNNSLTGPIPSEFGNLSELRELNLWNSSLEGPIPSALGNLSKLQSLSLEINSLTGPIPSALGNLSNLQILNLRNNSLTGSVPPELGDLAQLKFLDLSSNDLAGRLPRSFVKLGSLEILHFEGQGLCAPQDDEFQAWLQGIQDVKGPTCKSLKIAGTIEDQSYPLGQPITPWVLPEAFGGVGSITYTLTPALPAGLDFDSSIRTLSGTPKVVTGSPVGYIYRATDAGTSVDSLQFLIDVFSPVSNEGESLPEIFAVLGNYPNPFEDLTRVSFDLPWPAQVKIEVMDVTGRRVLTVPESTVEAGWAQSIEVKGASLSAGVYLYRLMVDSPKGSSVKVGRFVRVR